MNDEMKKVVIELKKLGVDSDLISPNLVADISFKLNVNLTSNQIVFISDNFS